MTPLDVLGIGNALVDVLSHERDEFVEAHGLARGTMTLVDATRAESIYAAMGPATEMSGGSAANTLVGVASFGGRAGFIGRVSDDQLGKVFGHDIRAAGVEYATSPASDGSPTGRCLIVVTPDAHRTMSTFLGASSELGPADIDIELVASSRILYLEGYLWDEPEAKAAFRHAAEIARGAGNRVAFTLSDPFCVDRHRDEFLDLVATHVDILFANADEIVSLFRAGSFDEAAACTTELCSIAALTRSELGAVVITPDETIRIPALSRRRAGRHDRRGRPLRGGLPVRPQPG